MDNTKFINKVLEFLASKEKLPKLKVTDNIPSERLQGKIGNALIDYFLEHNFAEMPDNEWIEVSVKVKLNPRDLRSIATTDLKIRM